MNVGDSGANHFRKLLNRYQETGKAKHIVGVHDCVSAKIAEAAGFEAVWISSLGLSVTAGKCDRNEMPWTSVADTVESIAEASDLPIIIDGDEGFGDNGIARLMSVRIAARGGACISFEDKTYPKKNSFADDVQLCSIPEFVEKIRVCKSALEGTTMSLMARTDSLVVREDMNKALERAYAYAEAGAEAVIVHSKDTSADEISLFMSKWNGACPIFAIPTSYDHTRPEVFDEIGVAGVIWANQLLRASVRAMQEVAGMLFADRCANKIGDRIISVKETLALADCGLGCTSH